jgi:hypothetical protein
MLCTFNMSYAMNDNITLPDAPTLEKRLSDVGFAYFAEKTTVVQQLAGQTKRPLSVSNVVESCLYDYNNKVTSVGANTAWLGKNRIIETILNDHPQAIEFLKKEGILTN